MGPFFQRVCATGLFFVAFFGLLHVVIVIYTAGFVAKNSSSAEFLSFTIAVPFIILGVIAAIVGFFVSALCEIWDK